MSRIALFFAVSSLCAMDKPQVQKKELFSQKPYLYEWPTKHSVYFDPTLHKIPFLGLITNTPQILTLEAAAMNWVKDTKSEQQVEHALAIQAKFGFYDAIPGFIAYCEWQKQIAKKKQDAVKK